MVSGNRVLGFVGANAIPEMVVDMLFFSVFSQVKLVLHFVV